jgi:uncharacterized protein (TIGR02145 family)
MNLNKLLATLLFLSLFGACTSSNDGGFAGGTTEDAGIIADLNVAGLTQKGPFVKGSAVTVQGIDCKTMKFTDEFFEGSVKSDKGEFVVDSVTLSSTCAMFEVSGCYLNELTGKKSTEKLTLHALTDLKDRKNVNINVLTELEYERVMNLVTEKGETFAEAKKQAEKEVLASFNINGDVAKFEDLNILEKGEGNAALLAVSVMVQASVSEAKLAERLDEYSAAISQNGSLDGDTKKEIANWATSAAANGKLDTIRKNIESWNLTDSVPAFETYVKALADGDSVTLSSSSFGTKAGMTSSSKNVEPAETSSSSGALSSGKEIASSSSTPRNDVSSSSSAIASSSSWSGAIGSSDDSKDSYLNPDIDYDEMTDPRDGQVYKTVKIGDQIWMAQNLNYADSVKTPSLRKNNWCYNDSTKNCENYGRLYTWTAAIDSVKLAADVKNPLDCGDGKSCGLVGPVQGICPDGWHLPSYNEWNALFTEVGGPSVARNVLKSLSGWNNNGNGSDAFGFSAFPVGFWSGADRFTNAGYSAAFWSSSEESKNNAYDVDIPFLAENVDIVSRKSYGFSVRCIKGYVSEVRIASGFVASSSSVEVLPACKTDSTDNCEYGTLTDDRDGQTYKTVKIGNQIWMAENLNYYGESDLSVKKKSWCFGMTDNGDAVTCNETGRLYTWAAAMDSAGSWSSNGKGCGYGKTCSPIYPVRGVCPSDWHLPTKTEFETLIAAVGGRSTAGRMLKSSSGWDDGGDGSDAYSFAAFPAGYRYYDRSYGGYGESVSFWSSTEGARAYEMYLYSKGDDVSLNDIRKDSGFSVRCIKD